MATLAAYFGGDFPTASEELKKKESSRTAVVTSGFSVEIKNDRPMPISKKTTQSMTIVKGMYNIDKRTASEAVLAMTRKALTVTPKGQTTVVARSYGLFKETTNYLQVPRFYGLKYMGAPSEDRTTEGEPMTEGVALTVDPRDYQVSYLKALQKIFARGGGLGAGALLVLACGGGKTYSAIHTAVRCGRKCAILVHNSDLLDQWRDRIGSFTRNASVGIVRSDCVEICDFTIFMMQSVITGRYDADRKRVFETFGMVVVDECHHIAAETLNRSLARFPARRVLGLSATPERKDGLGHCLHWFLGETVAIGKRVNSGTCHVSVEKVTMGKAREIKMKNGRSLISKTVTMMGEDHHRNVRIAKLAKRLFVREGRCILITSDRTKHLAALKECIMAEGVEEECVGIFKGETSKKRVRQREEEKKRPILIATYQIASEGFDKPELDTLIMATPKSSIEQVCGRILRSHAGKKKPTVFDFYDTYAGGAIIGMHRARMRFYQQSQYTIKKSS